MPSGNEQILSPWIALYFGLTLITTAFTIWVSRRQSDQEEKDVEKQFMKELEGAKILMDLASLKRSNSGMFSVSEAELETDTKTSAS